MLNWLIKWFKMNCNNDWEHGYGIKIVTFDNPGWGIDIDLSNTELENCYFEDITIDNGENDWYFCTIENNIFKGRGDPNKLITILQIFKNWVENANEHKHEINDL